LGKKKDGSFEKDDLALLGENGQKNEKGREEDEKKDLKIRHIPQDQKYKEKRRKDHRGCSSFPITGTLPARGEQLIEKVEPLPNPPCQRRGTGKYLRPPRTRPRNKSEMGTRPVKGSMQRGGGSGII